MIVLFVALVWCSEYDAFVDERVREIDDLMSHFNDTRVCATNTTLRECCQKSLFGCYFEIAHRETDKVDNRAREIRSSFLGWLVGIRLVRLYMDFCAWFPMYAALFIVGWLEVALGRVFLFNTSSVSAVVQRVLTNGLLVLHKVAGLFATVATESIVSFVGQPVLERLLSPTLWCVVIAFLWLAGGPRRVDLWPILGPLAAVVFVVSTIATLLCWLAVGTVFVSMMFTMTDLATIRAQWAVPK